MKAARTARARLRSSAWVKVIAGGLINTYSHPRKTFFPRQSSQQSFESTLASLIVFALLGSRVVILGAIIAALGFFYSHPKLNAKSTPIVSSIPHLVGGLFHFLLGYAVFMSIDERGLLIGLFFALTFTAGHLNHEVRDFELDSHNNARTNAVAFGKRPAFLA